MIIQKEIRSLIKDVADKHNVTFEEARDVIYSMFKYVREEMESGTKGVPETFKSIQLRGLGTFHFSKNKIEFLNKLFKEKKDDAEHN